VRCWRATSIAHGAGRGPSRQAQRPCPTVARRFCPAIAAALRGQHVGGLHLADYDLIFANILARPLA
jgi:hypothetical protein